MKCQSKVRRYQKLLHSAFCMQKDLTLLVTILLLTTVPGFLSVQEGFQAGAAASLNLGSNSKSVTSSGGELRMIILIVDPEVTVHRQGLSCQPAVAVPSAWSTKHARDSGHSGSGHVHLATHGFFGPDGFHPRCGRLSVTTAKGLASRAGPSASGRGCSPTFSPNWFWPVPTSLHRRRRTTVCSQPRRLPGSTCRGSSSPCSRPAKPVWDSPPTVRGCSAWGEHCNRQAHKA